MSFYIPSVLSFPGKQLHPLRFFRGGQSTILLPLPCIKNTRPYGRVFFMHYIFSGAELPISSMPLRSTLRTVSASFSRARRRLSSSPLMRQAL